MSTDDVENRLDRITSAAGRAAEASDHGVRVVGVLDLRSGVAVHARGGHRESYLPVTQAAGTTIDGDAVALARVYVESLGVRELYVADLDSIERGAGALQSVILGEISQIGVPVWVDAGVSTVDAAQAVLWTGASVAVVGLETLRSFDDLEAISSAVGGSRVAFSLDLRDDIPLALPNVGHRAASSVSLAVSAGEAGVHTIVVLDVGRVGSSAGMDLELIAAIRAAVPHVSLFVGGGVRDAADLAEARRAGADGALVATALLTGRLNV